jgi:hypothetical protein
MKRICIALIGIAFFGLSCSTLDQNVLARKNLAKCKFEVSSVEPTKVDYSGLNIKSVDFIVNLKITNKSNGEVALDHVEGEIFLDSTKAATIAHKNLVRIPAGKSKVEPINVSVPFSKTVSAIGKLPKDITIAAKLYVNIMIGSFTLPTPIVVEAKHTMPIPYDKIKKMQQIKAQRF